MSERDGGVRRSRRPWRWAWLGLALLVPLPGPTAQASPIHRALRARVEAARVTTPGSYWDRYFARALHLRSLRVSGPNALRVLSADASGRLPDCAFVDYLHWRRSLNALRFDRFHCRLGPILQRDLDAQTLRPSVPVTPGIVVPPTTIVPPTTPPVSPPPPPVNPPQIPEPASWLVALGLAAAGVAARRWALAQTRSALPG